MKVFALLLLVIVSATGYAATEEQQDAHPLDESVQRAASLLAQRDDADSLAAAAALTLLKDRAGAEQLAARASAAGPKRPDLLWLYATLCGEVPNCDRSPLDTKLLALDPENGVTLVSALAEAPRDYDPAGDERMLRALAATRRVDLYWNPLIAHLSQAVISTRTLTASQSVATVVGVLAAMAIPAFQGTVALCRDDELQRQGRRARCRAVARAFQQGDTIIVEMVGNSMARQLWPEDSREARAASEARRTSAYRMSVWGAGAESRLNDDAYALRYVDAVGRYRREQDLIVAEIVAAGRNPTPPANWSPPPPGERTPGPAVR